MWWLILFLAWLVVCVVIAHLVLNAYLSDEYYPDDLDD